MLWFAGLALLAALAYAIHKDQHDGLSVFLIGNGILLALGVASILYYLGRWLLG